MTDKINQTNQISEHGESDVVQNAKNEMLSIIGSVIVAPDITLASDNELKKMNTIQLQDLYSKLENILLNQNQFISRYFEKGSYLQRESFGPCYFKMATKDLIKEGIKYFVQNDENFLEFNFVCPPNKLDAYASISLTENNIKFDSLNFIPNKIRRNSHAEECKNINPEDVRFPAGYREAIKEFGNILIAVIKIAKIVNTKTKQFEIEDYPKFLEQFN